MFIRRSVKAVIFIWMLVAFSMAVKAGESHDSGAAFDSQITALEKELESLPVGDSRVDVLNQLAWNHIFGDPTKSKPYLEESLKISRSVGYLKGEAYAYDIFGSIFRVAGLYEQSIEYHLRSMRINERIDYSYGLGINHSNIGLVYAEQEDFANALEYHLNAMRYKKMGQDDYGLVFAYNDIITALTHLGRLDDALVYQKKMLSENMKLNVSGDLAAPYFHEANIFYLKGQMDAAQLAIVKVEHELSLKRNYWIEIKTNHLKSKMLVDAGEFEQASVFAKKALDRSSSFQMKDMERLSASLLAEIYSQIGDFEKAFHYLQIQNDIQYLTFGSNEKRKTALLAAKYEFEKEQGILADKLNLRAVIGWGVALLLLLFLGPIILVAYKYNRKNRYLRAARRQIDEQLLLINDQKEHLSKLNATKDKMFSIIGHDLRSPMASLSTLLELFRDNSLSSGDFLGMVDEVSKSVGSLNQTIAQLLQWANAQQQGIASSQKSVYLNEIVRREVDLFETTAGLKQIHLNNEVSPNHWVMVDEDQLGLVLRNLINNAVKFTQEGGSVTVRSEIDSDQDRIKISVVDTGVGMPSEKVKNIFKHSYVESTNGTSGEKGTGLGLILCKEMIESNGGNIVVTSDPGNGTTFSFVLEKTNPPFDQADRKPLQKKQHPRQVA